VEIYYNKKDYKKALALNQELRVAFPNCPSALYMGSRICEKLHEWEKAKALFQQLLTHLIASEYGSIGYEVECHYGIANSYYNLGEFPKALHYTHRALDLAKQRKAKLELEGPQEDFKEIVKKTKQLRKKLEKLN